MRTRLWPGIALVVGATIFGVLSRDTLPDHVASHWNFSGEADQWVSPTAFVFGFPALALLMTLTLAVAPRLDPKRRNFPEHAAEYWLVGNALLAFLAIVFVAVIGVNRGWPIRLDVIIGIGLGLLLLLIGNVMTRIKPNWILGLRTPWSLSSERSWRESHRVAGYGFVVVGLVSVVMGIVGVVGLMRYTIGGIIAVATAATVWSYIAWRRDPAAQGEMS